MSSLRLLVSCTLAGCAAPAAGPIAARQPPPAEPGPPAGPYLGQHAGDAPALFAPGFVSRRYFEMNAAFSPDGAELYFTLKDVTDSSSTIVVTRRRGERWDPPEVAPFSGRYNDVDPMFSPDGARLYFASYRPREPGAAPADADLWYVERRGDGFGDPVHVGAPVSTPRDEFYPSLTRDGTLYYTTWDGARRTGDLYRARPGGDSAAGGYQVEPLPAPVNTDATEYDAFVAPDERYLIFASSRPGGRGDGDLYISFRDGARWTEPANLGERVNTAAREYCPVVSPDGAYLLFTSKRAPEPERATLDALTARYDAIENGLGNVYWMRSDFLHTLRTR